MRHHQELATLAAGQYGVVTSRQLNALGYSDAAIAGAVTAGLLHPWHPRVFAVGHQDLSPHGLCMAAVLLRDHGALISHQSAIWLWGFERRLEIPVHITVRRRDDTQDAIGLHHCPALRDDDVAETERLPVTSVARTFLDYASAANPFRLGRAIDRADRLELLDLAAIDQITAEVRDHRGRTPLLNAMTIYREQGLTRSGGERRMLGALADVGVRRPMINHSIEGHQLDFYWDEERFAVELDSWEDHRDRRSPEEGRGRQAVPAIEGVETIRITGTRLRREPRKVAMRIAAHLDRRRQARAA
jgi:very-short-patch-repair endonuclease